MIYIVFLFKIITEIYYVTHVPVCLILRSVKPVKLIIFIYVYVAERNDWSDLMSYQILSKPAGLIHKKRT